MKSPDGQQELNKCHRVDYMNSEDTIMSIHLPPAPPCSEHSVTTLFRTTSSQQNRKLRAQCIDVH